MKYRELTKEEAHNMTVKSIENSRVSKNINLEFDKQKIMNDIYTLSGYGFSVTSAVYKNDKCEGYFESEDFLMENYKDIKKWLVSLGYKVSLYPPAWVPCNQHFLTIEWG